VCFCVNPAVIRPCGIRPLLVDYLNRVKVRDAIILVKDRHYARFPFLDLESVDCATTYVCNARSV